MVILMKAILSLEIIRTPQYTMLYLCVLSARLQISRDVIIQRTVSFMELVPYQFNCLQALASQDITHHPTMIKF